MEAKEAVIASALTAASPDTWPKIADQRPAVKAKAAAEEQQVESETATTVVNLATMLQTAEDQVEPKRTKLVEVEKQEAIILIASTVADQATWQKIAGRKVEKATEKERKAFLP